MADHAHPQAGIVNRPPEHVFVAAYRFADRSEAGSRGAVERLQHLLSLELQSDLDEVTKDSPKDVPSAETGELGFADDYDRAFLTVTFGLGAPAFEALNIVPEERPQDLIPIPWGQLGDAPDIADQADLVLQVCADNVYVTEHVLRRVEEELGDALTLVSVLTGSQRYSTRAGRTSRREGRALIGFLDGTANLRPRQDEEDAKLVFVDPAGVAAYPPLPTAPAGGYPGTGPQFPGDLRPPPTQEPGWTKGGTYMVVRGSVVDIQRWDDVTLGEQEHTIGRFKVSGSSLDLADDPAQVFDPPHYASDQSDLTVSLDAHVRKADPRRPEDAPRRIFRRGYPLLRSTGAALDRGLLFIAFARTISTQFEFTVRAWMRNPDFPQPGTGVDRLLAFDTHVLAGGYYFVPSVRNANKPWTWNLPWPPAR